VDENITYAQRLLQAGVPAELYVYQGAFHGAELMIPDTDISRRMRRDVDEALQRHLAK
jgi:acetyl esterase/lipase